MKLVKNNPAWPEHADFLAPCCLQPVEDRDDPVYTSNTLDSKKDVVKCPYCETEFRVSREVVYKYTTENL